MKKFIMQFSCAKALEFTHKSMVPVLSIIVLISLAATLYLGDGRPGAVGFIAIALHFLLFAALLICSVYRDGDVALGGALIIAGVVLLFMVPIIVIVVFVGFARQVP